MIITLKKSPAADFAAMVNVCQSLTDEFIQSVLDEQSSETDALAESMRDFREIVSVMEERAQQARAHHT